MARSSQELELIKVLTNDWKMLPETYVGTPQRQAGELEVGTVPALTLFLGQVHCFQENVHLFNNMSPRFSDYITVTASSVS